MHDAGDSRRRKIPVARPGYPLDRRAVMLSVSAQCPRSNGDIWWNDRMAQRCEPEKHRRYQGLCDEALEGLRNDPRVTVDRRPPGADPKPFVPDIRVIEPIAVLELLGRRGDDEDDERP